MNTTKPALYKDTVFLGLTRPSMVFGVPYIAFVLEALVTLVVFINIGNPLYLAMVLPIHGVLYLISANDHGIFATIAAWSLTSARCRNRLFWGATTFSPLSSRKWQP